MTRNRWILSLMTTAAALLQGCAAANSEGLHVTASAERLTTGAEESVVVEVVARNTAAEPVVWGHGSSGCQMHLLVRVDGRDRKAVDARVCTMDYVAQGLDPGESRSERIPWDGRVLVDGSEKVLPRGEYELRAAAGDLETSDALLIRVEGSGD